MVNGSTCLLGVLSSEVLVIGVCAIDKQRGKSYTIVVERKSNSKNRCMYNMNECDSPIRAESSNGAQPEERKEPHGGVEFAASFVNLSFIAYYCCFYCCICLFYCCLSSGQQFW